MADTNNKRALERLIDEIVDCAVSMGKSDAMKGFGAFTEIDSISMSAMRKSISQKRAQILGHFDSTDTQPADAALADDAIIELVTDYAQSKVRAESCQYHYESKEYDKEASETLEQIRAALRARAVPDDALDLLRKVAQSDVMSDRSGVMFVHLAIDRDVIDDINAMLAASKEAK